MNALLLFSYANINSMDDIESFYMSLSHGSVSKETLNNGKNMFQSLGTSDPLGTNTRRIGKALTEKLQQITGETWKYYIGNKHIYPFVDDAIDQCVKDGVEQIFTLSLTPFYSRTGTEFYEKQAVKALQKRSQYVKITHVTPFYQHASFVNVMQNRLSDAIHWLPKQLREEAVVIFTAHSMPGTEKAHMNFIRQYQSLAQTLAATTKLKEYFLAYRSRGSQPERWLEPDVLDVIKDIASTGVKAVIVCELLSVIANAEAVRELGSDAKKTAYKHGMFFVQTEYVNDSYDFINALLEQ